VSEEYQAKKMVQLRAQLNTHCHATTNYVTGSTIIKNTYRSFATRVSQLKIGHVLVTGIGRNVCRCTFNRYSVITQIAKLAAGEQLCSAVSEVVRPIEIGTLIY